MKVVYQLVAAGAAFAAISAAAQVSFYGVAAGGRARTDIDMVRSVEGGFGNVSTYQTSFDDTDAAWKLSGGLRLNRILGLEITYADLGKISTNTQGVGGNFSQPYAVDISRKVHGVGLDVVGMVPVIPARLDLIGKFGVYRTTIQADIALHDAISFSTNPNVTSRSTSGKEDITHVGVGLQAHITPRWAIRAEYERFMDVGNRFVLGDPNGTGRADIDVAWLGAVMTF